MNTPTQNSSRRDFMKQSTALAVGGALAGTLLVPKGVHAASESEELIKVGLIGCGGRGTGAVRDALVSRGPVKLVAMGDAFDFRLQPSRRALEGFCKSNGFADRFDVPAERAFTGLDAYQKVIDSGVDMVILATPPGFRPLQFEAAVKAGKHVFMEKPVCVDAPGCRQVLAAAEEAKKKNLAVGVGLQRRHQTSYQEAIKRLQDGAIGEIHTLRCYWNGAGVWTDRGARGRKGVDTEMKYQVDNWYYFTWLSGDHIVEQHVHNLDVCNWIKGSYPVWAQGMGGREVRKDDGTGEIFDHHAVEFKYADGSRMFSFCRHIPGCWDAVTEHAQGTKGYIDLDNSRTCAIYNPDGKEQWRFQDVDDSGNFKEVGYTEEHHDLYESIRRGEPINEAAYGALSSFTACYGRMATYSGKAITWDQAFNSQLKLGPDQLTATWETAPPEPRVAMPGFTDVGLA